MTDDPVIEHSLLWTTNEEYTSVFERYPAAKLRDQFTYFRRETLEKVKYQDSMNGTVIPYLVKRQQGILQGKVTRRMETKGTERIPRISLRDIEFGTNKGYVAVSCKRQLEEESEDGLVFLFPCM